MSVRFPRTDIKTLWHFGHLQNRVRPCGRCNNTTCLRQVVKKHDLLWQIKIHNNAVNLNIVTAPLNELSVKARDDVFRSVFNGTMTGVSRLWLVQLSYMTVVQKFLNNAWMTRKQLRQKGSTYCVLIWIWRLLLIGMWLVLIGLLCVCCARFATE